MNTRRVLVGLSVVLAVARVAAAADDHYKCYRARTTPFTRRTVTLVDEFVSSSASIVKPLRFCNPADKNGEGITDPTAHLMCYQIREPGFSRQTVVVRNQFGDQTLVVTKPESLCNPAEKDGVASPLDINHYKCYRAVGHGFTQLTVSVTDQFETQAATLVMPRLFCTPVDKNGEGIVDPAAHLTCYTIQPGSVFAPRVVTVVDQFADLDLTTLRGECRKRSLLCVPSERDPVGTTTTSSTATTTSAPTTTTSSSSTSSTPPAATSTSTSSTTATTASTSTTSTSTSSTSSSTSSTSSSTATTLSTTTTSTSSTTSMTSSTTSTTSSTSTSTSSTSSSSTSSTSTTTSSSSSSSTIETSTTTPIDPTTTTTEPHVAICGNREIEDGEQCDPPGESCPCATGPDGFCSDICSCLFCQS